MRILRLTEVNVLLMFKYQISLDHPSPGYREVSIGDYWDTRSHTVYSRYHEPGVGGPWLSLLISLYIVLQQCFWDWLGDSNSSQTHALFVKGHNDGGVQIYRDSPIEYHIYQVKQWWDAPSFARVCVCRSALKEKPELKLQSIQSTEPKLKSPSKNNLPYGPERWRIESSKLSLWVWEGVI